MPVAERISWSAALACTVWFLGFAWGEPRATLLAAPFVLVGALLLHRHLAAGSVLVLAAGAVTLLTGSSWGGPRQQIGRAHV